LVPESAVAEAAGVVLVSSPEFRETPLDWCPGVKSK
jgi:hypothetical protein